MIDKSEKIEIEKCKMEIFWVFKTNIALLRFSLLKKMENNRQNDHSPHSIFYQKHQWILQKRLLKKI